MAEHVRIVIYHARQCDPKKCTASKLERHGLTRLVTQMRFLPKRAAILNPFSKIAFSPADRERVGKFGLAALDCSWEHAKDVLSGRVKGTSRCLPILVAGNPVNYGKLTKLTTVEALAAALYIVGYMEQAEKILSVFKWGHTFLELNRKRLEEYSTSRSSQQIVEFQKRFTEATNTS